MGLELGIAASAGWSETGGPWVKPQDAMKKLVWSEAIIVGGARFNDVLPPPPTTTGPYQNLPAAPDLGNEHRQPDPDFYADVAVLGFRSAAPEPDTTPVISLADGTALDASLFSNGRSATGVDVPRGMSRRRLVKALRHPNAA